LHKEEVLKLCSALLDRLTVIKGYISMGSEQGNVDYSIVLLQELNALEQEIIDLVDILLSETD